MGSLGNHEGKEAKGDAALEADEAARTAGGSDRKRCREEAGEGGEEEEAEDD